MPRLARWCHAAAAALLLLAGASGLPAAAEEEEAEESGEESRLQVHGFLSQAYAASDGNLFLGIPEEGTSDYRTAALQIRYAMSPRDTFVLQLSHERLGESPLARFKEDVELDWVFYERELGESTSLRVGKVQIPLGIYNEILDVGTVLPFFRPPSNFYEELTFSNETVDGLLVAHTFLPDSLWKLDADAYWGTWDTVELSMGQLREASVEEGGGAQLWLSTPVSGLRFGLAWQRFVLSGGLVRPPGREDTWEVWQPSLDAVLSRFFARAEYRRVNRPEGHYEAYYGQLGLHLTKRLDLNLQAEYADLELAVPFLPPKVDLDEDYAVGLKFSFSSAVVAKAEVHRNEGYTAEDPSIPFNGPAAETTFWIVSLSASF
jgi:hypothetical protein